jgi:anthranilate synthase component I
MLNLNRERFEELKKLGRNFPVMIEFMADQITPTNMYYNLDGNYKFLLESAMIGGSSGRYTFLGENPVKKIKSDKRQITIETEELKEQIEGNLIDILEDHIRLDYEEENTDIPFTGGAVGYLGYDIIRHIEDIPNNNPAQIGIPEAYMMFYKKIVAYDHLKKTVSIIYSAEPDDKSYDEIISEIEAMHQKISKMPEIKLLSESKRKTELNIESDAETEKSFCEKVKKAQQHIVEGDIFQIVLSHRFEVGTEDDPFEIYRRLRRKNPSPYLYFIDYEEFQVIGSSPESLVKSIGKTVETHPIAGTRPRGKNRAEDEEIAKELLNDEKEIAEHMMLVDLGRNDIGKISKKKSVRVERFKEVDYYSHVMHIVSKVVGELRDDMTCFDALKACFPAGTVSGAPKIRAMELIDEIEEVKRELYAGTVGYFSYNGDMDVCIAIRTIVLKAKKAYIQAGAGIVYDSVPENEYREIVNKAKALLEVV